ncbi:MAG: ABC transporter permease [Burkholderiales bacterium]|nr:ABC transporter permease [Burkholderiales bacterium]
MQAPSRTSPSQRWCRIDRHDGGGVLHLAGAWQLAHLVDLDTALRGIDSVHGAFAIDGSALTALDTAAALLVLRHARRIGAPSQPPTLLGFDQRHRRVMEVVAKQTEGMKPMPRATKRGPVTALGASAADVFDLLVGHLDFAGLVFVETLRVVRRPRLLRIRELVAQFDQVCLTAIPVVALVTFLIGIVFTYLLGMQAEKYGANIFVVDGVAIGMCRELAPIIVATIIAGRSGAAFTAQLGTMRYTEETDAIRTLGLSPVQVLVLPRMFALTVALPLLVFVGDALGIAGAAIVSDVMLGITPTTFIERLHEALAKEHFMVGLMKAPVFAIFIAVIGCRMGMTVNRDTRSIGINTTSTVVQGIVAVILLDALFAIFFQELGI